MCICIDIDIDDIDIPCVYVCVCLTRICIPFYEMGIRLNVKKKSTIEPSCPRFLVDAEMMESTKFYIYHYK